MRQKLQRSSRSQRSHAWLIYIGVVVLYALVFGMWHTESLSSSVYIAGVALWALAVFPLAYWYHQGHQGVPMFELICLAYGAAYGIPIYLLPNMITITSQDEILPWDVVLRSIWLAGLGVGTLIAGYYVTRAIFRLAPLPRIDLPLVPGRRLYAIYFALFFGGAVKVFSSLSPSISANYSAILRVLGAQFEIGLILLSYHYFSARRPRAFELILLIGCTMAAVLLGLSGGMLEDGMLPLIMVLIVRWHVRGRFPIVMAVVAGALFLCLTPIKSEFRELTWYGEYSSASPITRLGVWVLAAHNVFTDQRSDDTAAAEHSGLRESVQRIDLLHKFAHVQTMTPAEVPYFHGLTYSYMWYTFIPRFLWHEKPLANEATDLIDYSYRFRSVGEEYKGANIAIGQIAEAFANFGWHGIIVVMLVQGIIFALLDKVLNGPASVGGRAIYLSVMVLFLNGIGTSSVILFGFIIQFVIASALLMRPFARGFTLPSAPRRNPKPAIQAIQAT